MLAVAGLTFLLFASTLGHPFVSLDDADNIYENPYLDPPSMSEMGVFWSGSYEGLWIPLTYMVWASLSALFGSPSASTGAWQIPAWPYHGVNVLLHALNAVMVMTLCGMAIQRRLPGDPEGEGHPGRESGGLAAAGGALLFALHPIQVEAVCWATGLKDVLSGGMVLASLVCFVLSLRDSGPPGGREGARHGGARRGIASSGQEAPPGSLRAGWAVAATLFALAAMLAKPSGVVAPLLAAVLLVLYGRWPSHSTLVLLGLWFVLAGGVVLVNKSIQTDTGMAYVTPLWARPFVAADALACYAAKIAFPVGLTPDHGRIPQLVVQKTWFFHLLWLPAGLALPVLLWVRRRALFVGLALFVGGVLPVLGLIPFDFQTYSTVAERYVYTAMLGPALALSWFLSRYGRPLVWRSTAMVLCLLAGMSWTQTSIWRESATLFEYALQRRPNSPWMQNNLGFALVQKGRLDEGIVHYREALRLKPDASDAAVNLGVALAKKEDIPGAIAAFRRALEHSPEDAEAHHNLGLALGKSGDDAGALEHLGRALAIRPDFPEAHNSMGIARARQGDLEGAVRHFAEAVRLAPANQRARDHLQRARAQLLRKKG